MAPKTAQEYSLLPDDAVDGEISGLHSQTISHSKTRILFRLGLWLLCTSSVAINILFLFQNGHPSTTGSLFANLVYEVPTPIYSSTQYGPGIGTEQDRDRHWNALDISPGIVAIPDEVADGYGLPRSQRFPWDQSVGVYLLGSYHQIHCLKNTYQYISALRHGRNTHISYEHVLHCLDDSLQDAYCHADDLPWMQLPPQPYRKNYPEYQTRQCKSWDKLLSWAKQYDACYRYDNATDIFGNPAKSRLDQYRFCPEGSPYTSVMEAYFEQERQAAGNSRGDEQQEMTPKFNFWGLLRVLLVAA